jgi:hypothetical protein
VGVFDGAVSVRLKSFLSESGPGRDR